MRGNNAFAKALSLVTGICASPLEVQASMLLALPACRGGEGLHGFKNNCQISLTPTAMTLAGQNTCYADLFLILSNHVPVSPALASSSNARDALFMKMPDRAASMPIERSRCKAWGSRSCS